MCLELYPECGDGGDGCCERRLEIALAYARRDTKRNGSTVPRIYCRLVDFQLYAVWAVKGGTRISEFVDACCPVCAKAEFLAMHFFDKAIGRTEPNVFAGRYQRRRQPLVGKFWRV
jgi:hypothetical protein